MRPRTPVRIGIVCLTGILVTAGVIVRPSAEPEQKIANVTREKYLIGDEANAPTGDFNVRYMGVNGGKMSAFHSGGINNLGHTCGGIVLKDQGLDLPCVWRGGRVAEIIELPGRPNTGAANAINDRDHVVGRVRTSSNECGFLWHDGQADWIDPPHGFFSLTATCINNRDEISGYVFNPTSRDFTTWVARAFLLTGGKMQLLPNPPGAIGGRGYGINGHQDVVG